MTPERLRWALGGLAVLLGTVVIPAAIAATLVTFVALVPLALAAALL